MASIDALEQRAVLGRTIIDPFESSESKGVILVCEGKGETGEKCAASAASVAKDLGTAWTLAPRQDPIPTLQVTVEKKKEFSWDFGMGRNTTARLSRLKSFLIPVRLLFRSGALVSEFSSFVSKLQRRPFRDARVVNGRRKLAIPFVPLFRIEFVREEQRREGTVGCLVCVCRVRLENVENEIAREETRVERERKKRRFTL